MKVNKLISERILLGAFICLFVLLCIGMISGDASVAALSPSGAVGSIAITVRDGMTDQPVQSAAVVIPESGQTAYTDKEGKTEVLRVPIVEDAAFRQILPKPWGEITVLVYKQGYIDCAIFHVNIWENQTRNGPTVLLFPADGSQDQPFTLTEGPGRIWVQQLLDQYKP